MHGRKANDCFDRDRGIALARMEVLSPSVRELCADMAGLSPESGYFRRTEADVERSLEKARQAAIEQMRYRAGSFPGANVVHSVRFQFVVIDSERMMVTAIGQAAVGEQIPST